MEKYLTLANVLYILSAIACFVLYMAWKSGRKPEESEVLLKKLNSNSQHPTVVVDTYAKEHKLACTRFIVEIPCNIDGVSYSAHFSVYLGDKSYSFGKKNNKWIYLKD